jgi:uracil-DNA glycosylase
VKVVDGLPPSDLAGVKEQGDKLLGEPYLYEATWKLEPIKAATAIGKFQEAANLAWARHQEAAYLRAVCSRLYVLRNQIFHGCSTFQSKANRDSLEPAVAVLSRLVPAFCRVVEQQGERALGLGEPPFRPREGGDRHVERGSARNENRPKDVIDLEAGSAERPTQWQDICLGVEKCLECIRVAPQAVTQPLKRGDVPDPPRRTRILFVGVAPTAQKKRNAGNHFYSSQTDALRIGLFKVLDRVFESDLSVRNATSLNDSTQRFIRLEYFFIHAAKVRPFYDDAPPPAVLELCSSIHLKLEIGVIAPEAVCFLGKNNLSAVAQRLFGKDVGESVEEVSMGSWKGYAAVAPQPRRGWEEATERVIRQLDVAARKR